MQNSCWQLSVVALVACFASRWQVGAFQATGDVVCCTWSHRTISKISPKQRLSATDSHDDRKWEKHSPCFYIRKSGFYFLLLLSNAGKFYLIVSCPFAQRFLSDPLLMNLSVFPITIHFPNKMSPSQNACPFRLSVSWLATRFSCPFTSSRWALKPSRMALKLNDCLTAISWRLELIWN